MISQEAENRTGPHDPAEKPAGTPEWKQTIFLHRLVGGTGKKVLRTVVREPVLPERAFVI